MTKGNGTKAWYANRLTAVVVALVLARVLVWSLQERVADVTEGFELRIKTAPTTPVMFDIGKTASLVYNDANKVAQRLEDTAYTGYANPVALSYRFSPIEDGTNSVFFLPGETGQVDIRVIEVRQRNGRMIQKIPLEDVAAVQHVSILHQSADRLVIEGMGAKGEKEAKEPPAVGIPVDIPEGSVQSRKASSSIFLFAVFVSVFYAGIRLVQKHQGIPPWAVGGKVSFVAMAGVIAVALALCMAVVSRYNAHPDEYTHIECARYYFLNWLPPAVDDPRIDDTFSPYGWSYMLGRDLSYFFGGKVAQCLRFLGADSHLAVRLVNVLLLGASLFALCRSFSGSLAPLAFLVTPQIWYIFSYANADAWPLFLSALIVTQLGYEKSALNRYLCAQSMRFEWWGAISFGGLLFLLAASKLNYAVMFLLVGVFAAGTLLRARVGERRRWLARWAVIGLVGGIFFGGYYVYDVAVNEFEKREKASIVSDEQANPAFKHAEAEKEGAHTYLDMRGKGVSLGEIFTEHKWHEQSFRSLTGVYHWLRIFHTEAYYLLMAVLFTVAAVAVAFSVYRGSTIEGRLMFTAEAGICVLVVVASVWHSWTSDFQAQGRYLFPVVGIAALALYRYREVLPNKLLGWCFGLMFALSIYSFVFKGLLLIPK